MDDSYHAPPGGGTALIEMLNLFDELAPDSFDPDSSEATVLFATIIRRARFDRRRYKLGAWPEFIERTSQNAIKKPPDLLSKSYARTAALELSEELKGVGETSHLNVIDQWGNVVALTQSIERSFGAKVATKELGFLYNGFMKGFKIQNKRHPHYLRPGAVARSNAAPTLVFQNNLPKYAIGSTGSERMVSGIFQVLVRLLNQPPFRAVKAPRLHCTPEGEVFLEAERFSEQSLELLRKYGFKTTPYEAWAFSVGGLQLAFVDGHHYGGVADPRRDGAAVGPDSAPEKVCCGKTL